jgi:hypothetical protein
VLKWYGDKVYAKIQAAIPDAMNLTMSRCAILAKQNHPGWNNVTGKAEGSIGVYQEPRREGSAWVGLWGSRNVFYMLYLEVLHGSALRRAALIEYPKLAGRIKLGATT